MQILFNSLLTISCFFFMEFVAWFTHKYIMHGFMWYFHRDHHLKDHTHRYERNDIFFLIFAAPAIILIYTGFQSQQWSDYRIWAGLGITLYGIFYLAVHDIFSHQRLRLLTRTNSKYLNALRRAHKIHHKNLGKENGSKFGFMFEALPYLKDERREQSI
ncbi:MAG: sterol desaturase family protein [Calditrichaeota bacterium]|nr:sterol desaturase family protein [Calditrichota bacterium]